jgi:hypothetical protein
MKLLSFKCTLVSLKQLITDDAAPVKNEVLENFFTRFGFLKSNLIFFERKQLREPGLVAAIGIGSSTETIYSVPILVILKPSTALCF